MTRVESPRILPSRISLAFAFNDYDRVAAFRDGRVTLDGCDVNCHTLGSEEIFLRTHRGEQWDVCEMSFSRYMMQRARGEHAYVAIPVFVSRAFRHGAIYVRAASGISRPEDLVGRRVGVPEYQMTAALWVRGMLSDDYGINAADIAWRTGGLERSGRTELLELRLPPEIDVQPIPADRTLGDELLTGGLDAIVASKEPSGMRRGDGAVRRLFDDYRAAEQAYFRRSGIFPIMHVVVVRAELTLRHPWLATSLYKAFDRAKDLAVRRLANVGVAIDTLPWLKAEVDATVRLMGANYWPYGIEANRHALETAIRYSREQGLCPEPLTVADLFPPDIDLEVKI
jgi:4,5-dihydroxyphthalate decarboxylase